MNNGRPIGHNAAMGLSVLYTEVAIFMYFQLFLQINTIAMKKWCLLSALWVCMVAMATAQECSYAINEVDDFDSIRLVVMQPISAGYKIPSQFLNDKGEYTLIDESKILLSYTENDSINCFFLTLALAERGYLSTEEGFNVLLKLSNDRVIALHNVPDKGEFDKKTNMRIYQHTCVMPLDMFYTLTFHKIEKIRVEYKGYKRTLEILPPQQEAIREAMRCLGEAIGMYPVKP